MIAHKSKILPGTGAAWWVAGGKPPGKPGTTKWWRGRLKQVSSFDKYALLYPTPPSAFGCHLPVPGRI